MIFDRLRGPSLAAIACALTGALALSACATTGDTPDSDDGSSTDRETAALATGLDASTNPNPFPSTYRPMPRQNMAVVGGTVFTATGQRIENGVVVVTDGRIAAVGNASTPVPGGHTVVDARGRFVTPGIIDVHSHLGVYPSPGVTGMSDGNELSLIHISEPTRRS